MVIKCIKQKNPITAPKWARTKQITHA